MKHILYLMATVMFAGSAYADGCDGILRLTRNINYDQQSLLIVGAAYEKYCSGTSVKSGMNMDTSIGLPIAEVPVELNLGFGSTRERVENLCRNYESWHKQVSERTTLAVSTDDKAIEAWRDCKAKEQGGVFFSVAPQREMVAISVRRGNDVIDFMGIDYNTDHIVCTGPFGDDGTEVQVDKQTRHRLVTGKEVPITCRRKYDESLGERILPYTEIAIRAEGAPPLVVPLPRDQIYEPSFASGIQQRMDDLRQQLDDERNQRGTDVQALNELLAKLRATTLTKRTYIFRGERRERFGEHLATGIYVQCGDPTTAAQNFCGTDRMGIRTLSSSGGNRCGYSRYEVSCYAE